MKNARILVVDDEANIRALLDEILSEEGYEVTTAADAKEARAARGRQDYDLTLLDIWMPDADGISLLREWAESDSPGAVVMMSGHGTVDAAVEATRLGAVDFIEKPVSLAKLLHVVESALAERRSRTKRRNLVPPLLAPVGKSQTMRRLREQVTRVAQHDAHTLLTGEPGSGREAFARYLSSRSDRAEGPFVVLLGSELTVSAYRGVLLGDGSEPGALARAAGGILFIHELQDTAPAAQQLLLSMLEQDGPSRGLPGREAPDVRVVASAPPGFERDEVFKRELLSHLSIIVLRVPPLREAREHFERAYLTQQLLLCGGKVGQLAKRVGMERTHLYRKLRSLGVDFRQGLTDD
ncbi:MAG TPA: response regulator [Gammaproteobacteria bacterium]|nr:response regulator [Gammaproteobacteria bacterium]